jgi:hypothetical protein
LAIEKPSLHEGSIEQSEAPIRTKDKLGDIQLHVEWAAPTKVPGESQGRGNSGVFLMGLVEVQVLDNYNNPTCADGFAGSVHGVNPPLANALCLLAMIRPAARANRTPLLMPDRRP